MIAWLILAFVVVGGAAGFVMYRNRLEQRLGATPTAAHESSAALPVPERRLEEALSAVSQGVVVCDGSGEVVFRNAFAEAFVEARHGDALVEAAINEMLAAAIDGEADERELDLFGPPRRTFFLTAQLLEDASGRFGAVVLIDDVTEHQRLDAMRRDFVANISHELKTPVGGLSLLAETLASEADPEVVARLTKRIQTEAARLGRTIDDLLELSRIEHDEHPVREPALIQHVVREAVDRSREAAERQGLTLSAVIPDQSITVLGDVRQLVSAVYNLLDNAIKYTDRGGSVTVRAWARNSSVQLEVHDTGIGIPRRHLDRIFERFYRVDKGRSRESGGTGLGLAIVRHVVNNHDGEVRVSSTEGDGSTFTLVLPTHTADSRQESKPSGATK